MKNIIPLGDRILVRRKKVGEMAGDKFSNDGVILRTEGSKSSDTELAEVIYVPDHSFADEELINNASAIIRSLTKKAAQGDSGALKALLEYNLYLKIKSVKVGDRVMISKYVGLTFKEPNREGEMTLVNADDIIGMVADE